MRTSRRGVTAIIRKMFNELVTSRFSRAVVGRRFRQSEEATWPRRPVTWQMTRQQAANPVDGRGTSALEGAGQSKHF